MAKTAIALIVAGPGDTDIEEITDLLNDSYPEDEYLVDLVVPASKSLYTKTVANVVEWFKDDKNVYPVVVDGEAMSRASSGLGDGEPQKVKTLSALFDLADFQDWDEVEFLVAVPDVSDEVEYDTVAEWVETAIEAGFPVKNLCAGLDDVVLEEPEEAAAESEPEPEAPKKRRSRAKAADDGVAEPDKVSTQAENVEAEAEEEAPKKQRATRKETPSPAKREEKQVQVPREGPSEDVSLALETLSTIAIFFEKVDESNALITLSDVTYRPLTLRAREAYNALARAVSSGDTGAALAEPEKATSGSSRGRGRPRTNFEVPQIWDDEEDDWVPRPKGRMRKGTKWRTIHAETNETLEEGVA